MGGNILMVSRSDLEADVKKYQQCCHHAAINPMVVMHFGLGRDIKSPSRANGRFHGNCKLAVQDLSILNVMMDSEHKKELALRIAPLDFVGCSWWQCLMKANGALANSLSGCGCHRDDTQRLFAKYLVQIFIPMPTVGTTVLLQWI